MTDDPPRIVTFPQTLCRLCGSVSNHVSGLCKTHRDKTGWTTDRITRADQAYLDWLRAREGK